MDKVDLSAISVLGSSVRPGLKPESKKTRSRGDNSAILKTRFAEILESFSPAEDLGPMRELARSEEALAELMDAVHSAGSDLVDRPFPDEILRYKKAVRNFIHYVVENGLAIEEIHTPYRDHRNLKPYIQIRVIDQKLEDVAAAILSRQTTQLERISKINEITGLLVDLTISGAIRERNE